LIFNFCEYFKKSKWSFFYSNYGVLNPEVIDFEILDESHGPHGEWKYSVLYREYFEHLPNFMENSAIGHYRVFKDNVSTLKNTFKKSDKH
jgi:hypothetical protein